jgi:hypothetical protein
MAAALDGWARIEAAQRAGLMEVPCIIAAHLSAANGAFSGNAGVVEPQIYSMQTRSDRGGEEGR